MMKKGLLALMFLFVFVLASCTYHEEENTLVVGVECAYAPFDWTSSVSTDYTVQISGSNLYCDGYDIQVASFLAEELGKELVVKKIEWTGLIPALQSGVIDVIISAMSPTEERKESVLFSDPYYQVDTVLVVRKDSVYINATSLDDFSGAKVIAQQDTIQDALIDQISNVIHQHPLSTASELVVSLESGVNDAIVTEFPVANAIVASNPSLAVVRFTDESGFLVDESQSAVSVAVRLNEVELVTQINIALSKLDDKTRDDWMIGAVERQPIGE
jgi:ABC-type amino acid transport substrate-binding protein